MRLLQLFAPLASAARRRITPILTAMLTPLVLAAAEPSSPTEKNHDAAPPAEKSRRTRPPLAESEVATIFEDTLGRAPSRRELRDWHNRGADCTPDELRSELRRSREGRELDPETIIRRAYRELLNREPDAAGMRNYRRHIIDRGWTPGQVREDIRNSDEYRNRRVDILIERAYDDILERKPDPEGREHYRRLLTRGGTEQQMRDRLRESVEYRVILPDSKVTRAYRDILKREPDQSGLESYRRKIVDEGWTEQDVRNALRRSAEYRDRAR